MKAEFYPPVNFPVIGTLTITGKFTGPKKLNPYFIEVFFRSVAGQMQIKRHITGATGQLHLYPRDVADFWIPILDIQEQQQFENLIQEARRRKEHAHLLLNAAKRAVEIAIETDEATVLEYLKATNEKNLPPP